MPPPDATALRERLAAVLAGRFELGDLLGVGGFAAVYRARDLVLERDVAIKVLEVPDDAAALERSLDEAKLVATIEHPNIVPLYEVGREQGLVFLVMRYYPDGSLARLLETRHQLPPAEVARLGAEVAEALDTAHQRGVVHLDIKPDNILLDAGRRAAVTDFGIAQAIGDTGPDGYVSEGTPHYMSPEHVSGDALSGRSDIYALGVVLYEAATGRTPVSGTTAQQVMANQVRQAVPSISSLVPEFPIALNDVIMRALAKDPALRWQSSKELAAALRDLIGSDRLLPPAELAKRARRRWYKRGAIGCVLLAIGLGIAGWLAIKAFRLISSGPRPAVDALAPNIPGPLLDSARMLGLLQEGDTALYLFVPAEHDMRDALVITQVGMVHTLDGTRRVWPFTDHDDVQLSLNNKGGFLIITAADKSRSDTVYRTLKGREMTTFREVLTRLVRERGQ